MATPSASSNAFRIVGFEPRWREDFARLNLEWLRRWFVVEPFDEEVLGNPERHILADGGRILFALHGERDRMRAVGTVALRHDGDGVYELTKMAVEPGLRGGGIGRALLLAAIELYQQLQGRELYLESSSVLEPALRLYESAGFVHHPAPRPGSHYDRADVHMVWEPPR
ncbi:MAG: N-acetyltransferase [Lysobacteraceae bacterium]|nr:MAG: N-acetyltransferase [Xanthomonadaceae bacterium]